MKSRGRFTTCYHVYLTLLYKVVTYMKHRNVVLLFLYSVGSSYSLRQNNCNHKNDGCNIHVLVVFNIDTKTGGSVKESKALNST